MTGKPAFLLLAFCLLVPLSAFADEATVTKATVVAESPGIYTFHVTLRHADSGWDHYADKWQVGDAAGTVLGERILAHPHIDEQPFTRSQSGIAIPDDVSAVTIRAHDTVHCWSTRTLELPIK